ncbi:MAG: site-2 protease family protein [Actinobacteria bacterium]|nr:site-2 protease family protein [Actinomycetota bacterium]
MQLIGILAFVVALLFSVMVHEFGHYITARRFGMRVTEFFLGFGPKIWSTVRGETEFGVKAIPAGGYCRIDGMSPGDPHASDPRAFYRATSGRKLIVLGAGSFLHFVLGFVLLFSLFVGIGTTQVTSTIAEVSPCVPIIGSTQGCKGNNTVSPAAAAGLKAGDRIVSIDGTQITDWAKDVLRIRQSAGKELIFGIVRGEPSLSSSDITPNLVLPITPIARVFEGKSYGFIGIGNEVATVRSAPLAALGKSASTTGQFLKASVKSLISLPGKIPALWSQTVAGKERDPEGLVGVVGVARVSGQAVGSNTLTPLERLGTFVMIIASLNIFVGVFNLLPILPLDGGHMAVAIADEVRAFIARLRGRARPKAIDVAVLTPVTMVIFVLLAGLTLLLLIADIVNPINLNL